MATEAGHIQISEFSRDVIPQINWMMEDLFCQYGVSIPYFMLDYDFPDYSERPDWCSGYNFNLDWGAWGYWLPWFNELLGLLWDEANLPRLTLPDLSLPSVTMFNEYMNILYDGVDDLCPVYDQVGTFTVGETVEGETSGATGVIKSISVNGCLKLTNPTGDFSTDEKFTGQTSGAYAFTSESIWESPMTIYNAVNPTYYIKKTGASGDTVAEAWDNYDLADVTGGEPGNFSSDIFWGIYTWYGKYRASGKELCLIFDTTDAPTGATTVRLKFDVESIDDSYGTPTLKIYRLDEAFDTTHYCSGGTYITEKEISTTGYHYIALTDADINQGGTTRFRCTLSAMCGSRPTELEAQQIKVDTPFTTNIYLNFIR